MGKIQEFIDDANAKWQNNGFSSPYYILKKKEKRVTYITPTQYDNLLKFLSVFKDFEELNIINSEIRQKHKKLFVQADIKNFIGDQKNVSFNLAKVKDTLKSLPESLCNPKIKNLKVAIKKRENIIVTDTGKEISLTCTYPESTESKVKITEKDIKSKKKTPLNIQMQNLPYPVAIKPPFDITKLDEITKTQFITPEQRKELTAKSHRKDYFVRIMVYEDVIESCTAKIAVDDPGIRITLEATDTPPPYQVFECKHFLKFKADQYAVSIQKDENKYWLVTHYEYLDNLITAYEELKEKDISSIDAGVDAVSGNEETAIIANLPDLEEIEANIRKNLDKFITSKIEIYKDLYFIWKNKATYFNTVKKKKYKTDLALYIKDTFQQKYSTYRGDAKIIKMLFNEGMVSVLDIVKTDMAHILRRIAHAPKPARKKLLQKIDKLDREKVGKEIKKVRKVGTGKSKITIKPSAKDTKIESRLNEDKKQLVINIPGVKKDEANEKLSLIMDILTNIDDQALKDFHEQVMK
jgi:hypothetical protein